MGYVTGFSEIVLIVNDVLESARFYREVVGLEPSTEPNAEWAWFWTGQRGEREEIGLHKGTLLFEEHSPYPPGERWGHLHFALNVEPGRVDDAVRQVRDAGVEVYGPQPLGRSVGYYFYDPDGNLVEFWVPNER
ncbi:MAG TPA: VOC family protein [Thermomicrobiaceae bacterium]|nr:VOC family protein [Thermomicrobiaceae bacterium]